MKISEIMKEKGEATEKVILPLKRKTMGRREKMEETDKESEESRERSGKEGKQKERNVEQKGERIN